LMPSPKPASWRSHVRECLHSARLPSAGRARPDLVLPC
jgi:hypothetical protein